jgi:hypothetical protein
MHNRSQSTINARQSFLICPIGSAESPERARSDQLMTQIVNPVLAEQGFIVTRADVATGARLLNGILRNLLSAELVVADITGGNPNVLYELGIRHATNLPCIIMIHRGERPPFDLTVTRYISYDFSIQAAEQARNELRTEVLAIPESSLYEGSELTQFSIESYLRLRLQEDVEA